MRKLVHLITFEIRGVNEFKKRGEGGVFIIINDVKGEGGQVIKKVIYQLNLWLKITRGFQVPYFSSWILKVCVCVCVYVCVCVCVCMFVCLFTHTLTKFKLVICKTTNLVGWFYLSLCTQAGGLYFEEVFFTNIFKKSLI